MRHHLDPDDWIEERAEIFGLYTQLGITHEDKRHQFQHAITGCSSLRYMTREEHQQLIDTLEQLAKQPSSEQQKTLQGLLALGNFDYQEME